MGRLALRARALRRLQLALRRQCDSGSMRPARDLLEELEQLRRHAQDARHLG